MISLLFAGFCFIMHGVLNVKIGDRFGRLLVLETSESGYNKKPSYTKCKCDCGNEIEIRTIRLWKMKSCGCMRINHGYHKTHKKEWWAWQAMKGRCFRKSNKRYPEWGGRGITVCNGIRYSVKYFIELIGCAPTDQHSVDRKNNDGNYSCGKCSQCVDNKWELNIRWATAVEQNQNKRDVKKYNYNGEIICLSEICRRLNISFKAVYARISSGWDFNSAITIKINKKI